MLIRAFRGVEKTTVQLMLERADDIEVEDQYVKTAMFRAS